jgi:hypothetical protein
MSPHAWTEDQLVEQPAIGLFAAFGWQTVSPMEETFGAGGTLIADWQQFVDWKLIQRDDDPHRISLEALLS